MKYQVDEQPLQLFSMDLWLAARCLHLVNEHSEKAREKGFDLKSGFILLIRSKDSEIFTANNTERPFLVIAF